MDDIEKQSNKTSKLGGYRPNSGRKKGTTNKISGATILQSVEKYCGEKFEDLLAQGYFDSIKNEDKVTRLQYEKMFLNKVVADKSEVDLTSKGEQLQATYIFNQKEVPGWDKQSDE